MKYSVVSSFQFVPVEVEVKTLLEELMLVVMRVQAEVVLERGWGWRWVVVERVVAEEGEGAMDMAIARRGGRSVDRMVNE